MSSIPRSRRIGILSTYPPRICGLATFASALELGLARAGDDVTVVALHDERLGTPTEPGRHVLINGDHESLLDAVEVLSRCDAVIVQHEYGVFGGVDGDEVLEVIERVEAPVIVVLHTVPASPTPHQRFILEAVVDLADRAVVMTEAARSRLTADYSVDPDTIITIPHGAWTPPAPLASERGGGGRVRLLTWGLLGPGKGIEHVIRAMSWLGDLHPRVRYTVAGVTHPNVLAAHGDVYRQSLIREAWSTGVARSVRFDDSYRDVATLVRYVASASVVVLPYDSREQVTSGVLVDAIAAGRPVIATAFPHAVELLSDGAGIVVPHGDPMALATAIRTVVTEPSVLAGMTARARELAPDLAWEAVATQYQKLCDTVIHTPALAAR